MPQDGRPVSAEIAVVAAYEDDEAAYSVCAVDGEPEEGVATFGDLFEKAELGLKRLPFAAGDKLIVRLQPVEGS